MKKKIATNMPFTLIFHHPYLILETEILIQKT